MNGLTGATTRTWDATSNTLTDNQVTVKKVTGVKASGNTAFQVALQQSVPLVVTKLVTSISSVTVSATGFAEIISNNIQGCLLMLGNSASALSMQNGAKVDEANCATQVNGSVSVSGGAKLTTSGVAAGGSISVSNGGSIVGTQKANAGTFTDPYAGETAIINALASVSSASGSAMNVGNGLTVTKSPGSYSGMNIDNGANVTLSPGMYYINGQVNIAGGATVTGTGVTIVTSGQMSINNGTTVTLTAPTTASAAGIPGVALVGKSAEDFALNGGSKFLITGVLYTPNAHIEADNGFGSSALTCSIFIAKTITINGGAKIANNCDSTSGVKSMPVPVGNPKVALVK